MQTPGEILRTERERKGLSIKDVEQATSIRSLYLNAIEEGNYSIVPGEVYLKGFIRNYATFLGLNSQEVMELYRQTQIAPSPVIEEAAPRPAAPQPSSQKVSQKVREHRKASSPFKWIAIIAILFIAGAAGYWWYTQSSAQPPTPINNAKPAPVAPAQPSQPSQPSPGQQQPAAPINPVQAKPVVISAKYTDECWTQVFADGKEVYEGIPKIGATFTWEAQQNVTLRLGNANGVDITYNGIPQGKLGAKGDVLVKTFTPKL